MKITEITRCDKNVGIGTIDLTALPLEFQDWVQLKKLSAGDLAPLRALPELKGIEIFLKMLARLAPSKSDGVVALELAVDLLLMGVDVAADFNDCGSFQELYGEIKKRRFPLATRQVESAALLLKKLPWPKKTSALSTRMGDQSGVQVKLFFHSRDELKAQIEGLTAVWAELERQNIKKL